MKLVVGLGNPGIRYQRTRHNAGWMALDELARLLELGPDKVVHDGLLAKASEVWLLKPLTYMNNSGWSVVAALDSNGISLDDMLVLVDDLNLPLGTLRLRAAGSSGGHKGLDSIIEALGTEEFPRLRMGIGPCAEDVSPTDFVTSDFARDEWPLVEKMTAEAAQAAQCWAEEGIEAAMARFNGPGVVDSQSNLSQ